MNALTQITNNGSGLIPSDMGSAIRLAEMMSTGKLMPAHFHGKPGDCLMVVEQAMRWGMSPFAVAQCTSVISGKLMYEGKLVAAAIQASGILSGRLDYAFSGQGDTRAVTVRATIRGEDKPREITVVLKDVKTANAFWTKQPDQQLVYSGTRAWGRRHAPEVMLGVYSPEEFEAPRDTFAGATIDARAEPAPVPRQTTAQAIGDSIPSFDDALGMAGDPPTKPKPKATVRDFLDRTEAALIEADTAGIYAIIDSPDVQRALKTLTNGALDQLNAMLKLAMDRTDDGSSAAEPASDRVDEMAGEGERT